MSNEWTPPSGSGASVPNYLIPAIISIFCCLPLGVAATIFAAQVNGKVAAGDIQGATESAKKAKLFAYISIGLGVACWGLYILLMILGFGVGMMGNM